MGTISAGKSSETSQATIAPRSAQERRLAQMLERVAGAAEGGLGNINAIASGDLSALSASGADRALIEEAASASSDIANRQIDEALKRASRTVGERATAQGIDESSIEAALQALAAGEAVRSSADVADRSRQFTAESMLNLPFQRANLQLGANAQLFNQLVAASSPVLEMGLRERMAQAKTETKGTSFGYQSPELKIPGF